MSVERTDPSRRSPEPPAHRHEMRHPHTRNSPTIRDFGDFYNARKAASELRRYRNQGPIPSTRTSIDALTTEGVTGATVIDTGGGIGAVQRGLLAAGAAHVTSVDASNAYLQTARQENERHVGVRDNLRVVATF